MSLPALLVDPETPEQYLRWIHDHAEHHLEIRDACQTQKGVNLAQYVLDPVKFQDSAALGRWLIDHQAAHNDFNALFGLQANDLTAVDFKSVFQRKVWIWQNFIEHRQVAFALGI